MRRNIIIMLVVALWTGAPHAAATVGNTAQCYWVYEYDRTKAHTPAEKMLFARAMRGVKALVYTSAVEMVKQRNMDTDPAALAVDTFNLVKREMAKQGPEELNRTIARCEDKVDAYAALDPTERVAL